MAPLTFSRRPFLRLAASMALAAVSIGSAVHAQAPAPVTLLNVSYDPTRELYVDYNAAFTKYWKAKTGQDVSIKIVTAEAEDKAGVYVHLTGSYS